MASNTVGRFAATALDGEPEIAAAELPVLVRDAVAGWLLERGGHLDAGRLCGALAAAAAGPELQRRALSPATLDRGQI